MALTALDAGLWMRLSTIFAGLSGVSIRHVAWGFPEPAVMRVLSGLIAIFLRKLWEFAGFYARD
jgi:hypothetical protein